MPRFEEVLNGLLRISNIDIYVTGSNSRFLSSDIITEFRGIGDKIRVYPLSFAEFYSVYDGEYEVAYDITSKEKQAQELYSLRNIPDSFKKIVIAGGTANPWRNEEGFVIMGMRYFLLNSDSLEF